jgi:hypothetical protein
MAGHQRAWLGRIGASLGIALCVGLLAYLVTRGVTGALLFVQQQQLLREVVGVIQGGLEGPPSGDLRAVRLRIQELDARNARLSFGVGFLAAAVAVVGSYLWLERRAELEQPPVDPQASQGR